jgi:hypothetical protein
MTGWEEKGPCRDGGSSGGEEWRKGWPVRLGWQHTEIERKGKGIGYEWVGGIAESGSREFGPAAGMEGLRWREDVLELGETGRRRRSWRPAAEGGTTGGRWHLD